MNTLEIISIFFNSMISVGSSVVLLYADTSLNNDIKELNIFLASIFTAVNFYTIFKNARADELGYTEDYKAVNEESIEDEKPSEDFHIYSHESNLINDHLNSLYEEDELYEENI